MQKTYNPADYGFHWTTDNWYKWDSAIAHVRAKRDRDSIALQLRHQGKKVNMFTERNQLISKGGIGSGHPHIEMVVTIYGLNAA